MAVTKITQLPPGTSLNGTELLEAVQDGRSVRISSGQIATYVIDGISVEPPVPAARVIWVDPDGSDNAIGTVPTNPLRTLTAAISAASPGDCIRVQAGIYTEDMPLVVPRDVSIVGDGLRVTELRPTTATSTNNMLLVDSGFYCWGITFARHQAGSWAISFNANADNTAIGATSLGAYVLKSPYIQNCTSYTAQDDSGTGGSTSNGTTGGGMEVDGAKCALNSPIRSMVVDSYTQINLDGPGCLVRNDGYAQLVSFFGTFCSYHVKAEIGGQINLSNSTTDFGTFGLVADGRSATPLFSGTGAAAANEANQVDVTSMTPNRLGGSSRPALGQVFDVGGGERTVTGATPITGGWRVTFYPKLTASFAGGTISFYQRSQIMTGGHNMEFVGAGTNYLALPWNGGVPIQANEIVETNGGRVFYSTTDHLGTFRVGPQFSVDGTTGEVTINTDSFNVSGLNQIGPFSRDGGQTTVGVQLREVSNNTSLLASTGVADGNTAPTQYAVVNYLAANYATFAQGALADSAVQPGDLATVATTGAYSDLTGRPALATVATTGAYSDLTGRPALATVATTGAYSDLTGQPTLATVATTGAYSDLTGRPTLGTAAALNVGTGALNVVQLDAVSKLPSVDGSQLTNLPINSTLVVGPASATNNNLAQFDGTTGKLIKNGPATPTGAIVGTTDTQTLTGKTLTDPAIIGTVLEDVFTITDGAAFEIDPGNGSIQLITLGASRTPKATNFLAGEAVTLMVDDGTAFTITWTDATFGGTGVVWETNGGVAPTLSTTGYTAIVLWKVGTQVYGARVGNA